MLQRPKGTNTSGLLLSVVDLFVVGRQPQSSKPDCFPYCLEYAHKTSRSVPQHYIFRYIYGYMGYDVAASPGG